MQLGTAVCSPFCALGWGKFPFCPCPLVHLRFPCHVVGFHFYLSAILPFITLLIFTCCGHWCLTLRLNGLQWYMLMVMQLHTFVLVCYVTVHTWNVKRHTSHFSALGKQHLHTPSWPTLVLRNIGPTSPHNLHHDPHNKLDFFWELMEKRGHRQHLEYWVWFSSRFALLGFRCLCFVLATYSGPPPKPPIGSNVYVNHTMEGSKWVVLRRKYNNFPFACCMFCGFWQRVDVYSCNRPYWLARVPPSSVGNFRVQATCMQTNGHDGRNAWDVMDTWHVVSAVDSGFS